MKYFLDTEFLEGTQKKLFGETKPIIDLISIGIVCEDGREYYAISKDFNLKEAWNRYDIKTSHNLFGGQDYKVYWIRDNVLKPIFYEMYGKDINFHNIDKYFTYKEFKKLINKYGKTNKQIAEEIVQFVDARWIEEGNVSKGFMYPGGTSIEEVKTTNVQFYGYYADYDWVVFCWLFGKMIDLPKGFPMYCNDLKQTLDDYADINYCIAKNLSVINSSFEDKLNELKSHKNYPKQTNEHNALADARWNYELYKFLNTL